MNAPIAFGEFQNIRELRWVLLISFVRFRDCLRGQIVSERRSYAGITTERMFVPASVIELARLTERSRTSAAG